MSITYTYLVVGDGTELGHDKFLDRRADADDMAADLNEGNFMGLTWTVLEFKDSIL